MVDEVVLLIDPDEVERRRLKRAFAGEGIELLEAASAIEGLFETLERDPVLILLAEQVPPLEAGELLLVLRRITGAPVIVIGSGDEPDESFALELGADFYLRRPFGDRVALARARALIRRYRGGARNARGLSAQAIDLAAGQHMIPPGVALFQRDDPGRRAAS